MSWIARGAAMGITLGVGLRLLLGADARPMVDGVQLLVAFALQVIFQQWPKASKP